MTNVIVWAAEQVHCCKTYSLFTIIQYMKYPFSKKHLCRYVKLFALCGVLVYAALSMNSCAGEARAILSSSLGRATDPVPFMESARTGTLPSGLRYYLLENTMPEGRVFLTLAVNAGSILETEDERGLAHFVEHMAFNGTKRFPGSELVNYLRSLGMRFGPEINAFTSFDETVYGIEVPVETAPDGRRIVPDTALAVIDDWSWAITFHPDEVDNERRVILEEYRFRMGARERINRAMFPVLFRGSLYADRLPIGRLEVLEHATPEQLQAFYQRWYRPENMAVIIAGDFDAAFLEAQLSEHFPVRENNASLQPFYRPRHDLRQPEKGSLKTLALTDSELTVSRVDLYWQRQRQIRRGDLASYRESIIDDLADIMLSLRFEEASAEPEVPFVWAAGGMLNYGLSSRFYVLTAQAKTGSVRDTLGELLLTRETLSRHGFTQVELDIAAAALVSNMEQAAAEKDRQNSNVFVNSFTQHFLRNTTVPDIEWSLEAVRRLLPGISLAEINRAVRNYFADDDLTIIVTAPDTESGSLPTDAEIRALAAQTRRARIARPVVNRARGELLPFAPQPGTIVSETVDSETGAIRWRLGNGAEVILRETANRNNEISFFAQARGGTLSAPDEISVSANLAAEMLNASGLGPFTRTELINILADKQAGLSFWTQSHLRGLQGSAAVRDIQTLFEMLYLGFTQPRFDPNAVNVQLAQLRSNMTFQENDPNTVFGREIARITHGNPRFHPLELADLERFDIDEALAFIRSGLNPADFTFVFTGNIELPLLRSLTETYLASIPRSQPFDEWAVVDPRRPPAVTREIRMGREERSIVYLSWFVPQPYSEEKAAAVSALSEYLDIRLTDKIREALGGVYSISSWVSISPIPAGELSGGAFFICDPERAEELIAAVKAEFDTIAAGNIDADVFAKAIEALIQNHEQAVQSNRHIAQSYANSAVIFRSPLSRLNNRPALFRSVRPADITRTMAELLRGNPVRLVLKPEGNAGR